LEDLCTLTNLGGFWHKLYIYIYIYRFKEIPKFSKKYFSLKNIFFLIFEKENEEGFEFFSVSPNGIFGVN
jgi:hypothetical protein